MSFQPQTYSGCSALNRTYFFFVWFAIMNISCWVILTCFAVTWVIQILIIHQKFTDKRLKTYVQENEWCILYLGANSICCTHVFIEGVYWIILLSLYSFIHDGTKRGQGGWCDLLFYCHVYERWNAVVLFTLPVNFAS